MIQVRRYGSSGPPVVLLHGGPGAPGYMAPVGRELASAFRVLEPLQRRASTGASDSELLTVARHVEDLREVVEACCPGERPALVGSSWGAMLALAYAARHPGDLNPLVLVGCGTFDRAARARFHALLDERLVGEARERIDRLAHEVADPDEVLARRGELLLPAYSFDLLSTDLELAGADHRGNVETWRDMVRLETQGFYPAAFDVITAPVLMLHGDTDPHPGGMIRATLAGVLPQLEYVELERCGHYPWLERHARQEFFGVLGDWLVRRRS
ncbi:MAG TPA: alpha/beta hydrolase [Longimicrobiales bacterium]